MRGKDEQLHIVTSRVKVGDVVWIREAHYLASDYPSPGGDEEDVYYRADEHVAFAIECEPKEERPKWTPSILMFRKHCRILRRVTRVWFERVQDISVADATAEGCVVQCNCGGCIDSTPRGHFQDIWRECYGYGAWDENWWNVCKEFEPIEEA